MYLRYDTHGCQFGCYVTVYDSQITPLPNNNIMAGFHPAAGKVIDGEIGDKKRHHRVSCVSNNHSNSTTTTLKNNNDDEDAVVESDSNSSDYDQPYHETALDWYNRHVRQRSRRLAGISSSSSSSSSECGSISSSDSEDDDHFFDMKNNCGNDEDTAKRKRRKEMAQAVRSAERPLKRWLASYPLVAARSCLSSVSIAIATDKSTAVADASYFGRVPRSSVLPLPPRMEETKRLGRILRRLRRKRNEFREKNRCSVNATGVAVSSVTSEVTNGNGGGSFNQTSNEPSLELTTRINHDGAETPESDHYAIHSFLPQGTGISFIDAALARESLLQSKLSQQQKSLSRLVLELVSRSTAFFLADCLFL
jgi:hypothetical protein